MSHKRQRYLDGKEAFELGYDIDQSPHREGEGRKQWFKGYLDARTGKRLRKVFRRNAIRWP